MLAGMTSRQFTEWMAFFKIEGERTSGESGKPSGGSLDDRLMDAFKVHQAITDSNKKRAKP